MYCWFWVGLVGAGLILTFYMGGIQWRGFLHAIKVIRGVYDRKDDPGEITHFQALSTALSATVGLGNIAGVAVAIQMGAEGRARVESWFSIDHAVSRYEQLYSSLLASGR